MNQNKNIYLIDLGDEITWCDSPDPSDGIEESDVTGYVRADIHKATILKLCDALDELVESGAYYELSQQVRDELK